jgi:rRNA maturation protein Nop10
VQGTCPQQQKSSVHPGSQKKGFVALFDSAICSQCPFWQAAQCPASPGKRDAHHHLRFQLQDVYSSQRRRLSLAQKKKSSNLRATIEATIRSVKHPLPTSKLPLRGSFRITGLVIGSASLANIRRIQRYLEAKNRPGKSLKVPKCSSER